MEDITGWFCLWCVVGLICGAIASQVFQSKGKSASSGFLLGLLLGIIGIIVALLIPADVRWEKSQKFRDGQLGMSPHCKEFVQPDARICRHCRSELHDGPTKYRRQKGVLERWAFSLGQVFAGRRKR
jgi:uncharacterized membrane protein YeaQ/YmgE (transglycosylase-associated protein family)